MRKVGFLMLMFLVPHMLLAQRIDEDKQAALDQMVELISENLEVENLDFTTLLEDLNYFYEHPLNINRAERDDLRRLIILSEFQIEAIIRHREYAGRFISTYELQGVEGFDLFTIQAILPFVRIGGLGDDRTFNWEAIKKEGSSEAFIRYQRVVEQMEGYSPIEDSVLTENPNRRYLGSPERVLARYRFRYLNNLSVGVTMEKDAGEQFFGSSQPNGFDFYSGHIYVGNRGVVKQAIIGDYQAQFGQGLTFWSGLAFGKSADVASVKRNAREISPYTSADENNFMRGAATTMAIGQVDVTTFFSYKNVDANVNLVDSLNDQSELVSEFSSFQLSGIHGTPSQLEDKDAISEMNTGGHIRYNTDAFQIGVTGVYTKYGGELTQSSQLYRNFEPFANEFFVAGFDYQFIHRNIMAYGENSLRLDGGTASINGANISLDQGLDVSILHRNFSASYNSPRSNAVSESSRNVNESGLYMGFSAKLGSNWKFTGCYDMFSFPWLRYGVDAPSDGTELLTQLEFRPSKRFKAYARYRFEHKQDNFTEVGSATSSIGLLSRQWYRLNWQYESSKTLSLRSRIELVNVDEADGNSEKGWLVYQDFVWKPSWPAKYELKLRYAMFDTESYTSRIYAYENDVLYSFSVPAVYYRGSRAYIILKYDITRWSDLSVRVAQTYFANRDESGSGLNRIDGPSRTEVKVQLHMKF